MTDLDSSLRSYTERVNEHLKNLSFIRKYRDRRLGTTRKQYHLYMLEIELTNRHCRKKFLQCDRKIALLPYCLQDFSAQCKAEPVGDDYRCKHCSRECYQNFVHSILEKNDIEPFIWMGSGINSGVSVQAKPNMSP